MKASVEPINEGERELAKVIACRGVDGSVRLTPGDAGSKTLEQAVARGFVSGDGCITREGRRLLARINF